jgi:lipoprotein-anchoring transpeptidase ErfK/SrfK
MSVRILCSILLLALLAAGCASPHPDLPPARVATDPAYAPPSPLPPPTLPTRTIPPVIAPPPPATLAARDIAAVQALLDRANFSPGVIDGVLGPKTRTALRAWQERNGLAPTGDLDSNTLENIGALDRAFTTHVVTEADRQGLAPVPSTWAGKSQAERLGYETVLEAIAERYHSSQALIRQWNPGVAWPNPPDGTILNVPNPRPFSTPVADSLHINLGQKIIYALDRNGNILSLFPCSIARHREKRPVGELTVINCAENPNYYFDPAIFTEDAEAREIGRKLVIPAGPNNPVGVAWISLSLPGYGIHGTPHPEDIGRTESHGCFRLANWNAAKLVRMIRIGMPVVVEE